ncbi:hypothetical protein LMT8_02315 [Leuconostoc mesenteroides subsp. cremoris TIFN8]|nr:hypothetical protein LMT8_02315 [Leuconostoc mesenteroides subsp. cremoris TIFN8]
MDRIILGYSQYLDNLENMINNMISYQLNMIMKTLTEISIVLTIPAIIFGFWGINVHVPFEKSSYGFFCRIDYLCYTKSNLLVLDAT